MQNLFQTHAVHSLVFGQVCEVDQGGVNIEQAHWNGATLSSGHIFAREYQIHPRGVFPEANLCQCSFSPRGQPWFDHSTTTVWTGNTLSDEEGLLVLVVIHA